MSAKSKQESNSDETTNEVMNDFYRTIRIRILKGKEACLLHHLLSYLKEICEEYGCRPIHEHSVSLKRDLLKQFKDLDFFPAGKYVVVHSSNMKYLPCQYSIAVLKVKGLQDKDYVLSFGNSIQKKTSDLTFEPLPESPDDMIIQRYLSNNVFS